MSWIQKLYETYENCQSAIGEVVSDKEVPLLPICHTTNKAQIEIVIDQQGNFKRARVVSKNDARTIIPCTETSGGRTSGEAPHPLSDKLQYIAGNYLTFLLRPFEGKDINKEFIKRILQKKRKIDELILEKTGKSVEEIKKLKKEKQIHLIVTSLNNWEISGDDISKINNKIYLINKNKLGEMQWPDIPSSKIELFKRIIMEYFYPKEIKKISYHRGYQKCLKKWCRSRFVHPKVQAVLKCITKGRVIEDLISHSILINDDKGKFKKKPKKINKDDPEIFTVLNEQSEAFVRWEVEIPNDPCSKTWEDKTLWVKWIDYYSSTKKDKSLCYVTGKELYMADIQPAKLRHDGDKAKLISSNDMSGFTFRGRFEDANQACGIGFEVTQKAHSALRWLISRQGYRNGGQAIVAWATSGKLVPDPLADPPSFLGDDELLSDDAENVSTAQNIAIKFKNKLAGYKADLGDTSDIVVMGLDSATPGRMAMTYYRELTGADLLLRVEKWHESCSWVHDYRSIEDKNNKKGKRKHFQFIGAPAPRDIAEAAYGSKVDDKLRKTTVERLLPCIIDGQQIPRDIVISVVRRACNRVGMENWEWNKTLSIACALYRKLNEKEEYSMALDEERRTRDYLYGRLLALADSLEQWALSKAGENRQTNAARLMQRFADHPYSTWRTIELSLAPYKARLGGQGYKRQALIDEVHNLFDSSEDYISDKPLSGEFLLAYHSQRVAFWKKDDDDKNEVKVSDE